jgi:class 3 adenylate cyclase
MGPWVLADTAGGRDELKDAVEPRFADVVDEISLGEPPPAATMPFRGLYSARGAAVDVLITILRLHDDSGRLAGTAMLLKPAVGMAALSRMTAMGDLRHFEHMERVAKPGRRPAAILFADLESSSKLARRLSTGTYFKLVRRMARAADDSVIESGGLVGRHVGDGVVAFFLAEIASSESAAARACIAAARSLKLAMKEVAASCELDPTDVVLRLGLHWGATLYVGQIATAGRAEITALGDGVNEGARIEACATGGRILASKDLIERLDPADAASLQLEPDHLAYTPLGELASATEKARRDAPAVAVIEL